MSSISWRVLALLLCAAIFVAVAAQDQDRMLQERRHWGYNPNLEGVPPAVILATNALGGFRGILVDLIWIRAIKLQQQAKYWELVQLYDWMGKMQPYIEPIWEYNAWNMSYNIVAELKDPDQRWLWIQRGLDLLHSQGLQYLPESAVLANQLAWIYWQKIGGSSDEYNMHYKHRWALTVDEVFGPFHSDVEPLANAPRTEEDLFRDPECEKFRKQYNEAAKERQELGEENPGELKKDNFFKLLGKEQFDGYDPMKPLFTDEKYQSARTRIEAFYRAPMVKEKFSLDLRRMLDIQRRHGKLDWRMPDPHAIYYAEQAFRHGKKRFHRLTARRLVFYSLKRMYLRGKVAFMSDKPRSGDNPDGIFVTAPNYEVVPHINRIYRQEIASVPFEKWELKNTWQSGHESWLKDLVRQLYYAGLKGMAAEYFNQLKREYHSEQYKKYDMVQWVQGHTKQFVTEYARSLPMEMTIRNFLRQSFFWLAAGDRTQSAHYHNYAKDMWSYFVDDTIKRIDKPGKAKHIAMLPTFEVLRDGELRRVVTEEKTIGWNPLLLERLKRELGKEKVAALKKMKVVRPTPARQKRSRPSP